MHILILEAGLTGHHANYLEHIASTFLAQGHKLTISVREEHAANPLFSRLQARHPGRVDAKAIPPLPSWTRVFARLGVVGSELSYWLMFKRFFQQLCVKDRVDHVFFPYLDYCLHATALLGSLCDQVLWSGICMRPSFHYSGTGVIAPKPKWRDIKERLFYRLLRQPSLHKLLTIDELLEQYARQKQPLCAQKLAFVPDPAELTNHYDRTSARHILNIPEQDYVILVYGAIDCRKGIEYLLAATRENAFPRNLTILVAGKQTLVFKDKLLREQKVISVDQYVDSATEEAVFRASDAVWLGYRSHYSMSGVLMLAAVAAKPVLATRNGLIGWLTRTYDLGISIDCEKTLEVERAVHALMEGQKFSVPNSGMQTIQARHSWAEFDKIILRALPSSCLPLPKHTN